MNALKTLMMRSLDYAGVFPPAKLPLNDAVSEFVACLRDENAWLIARFVLPVGQISEFAQVAHPALTEAASSHQPWHVTGLLRTKPSIDDALAQLRADVELLRGFAHAHPSAIVVDSCELPLPDEVLNSHDQEIARGFLAEAERVFDEAQLAGALFWEVNLAKSFEHIALAVRQSNHLTSGRMGLKFRTGGLTADAIVSPAHLARAFRVAQQERIPFKLTAGLHLALRHFDAAVGGELFGFLNTFSAAVLGWKHELSETELRLLLEEKNPAAFELTEQGLKWKNYQVSIADIRAIRADGLRSFGSCSFHEPIDDLKSLKLLP